MFCGGGGGGGGCSGVSICVLLSETFVFKKQYWRLCLLNSLLLGISFHEYVKIFYEFNTITMGVRSLRKGGG